MAKKAEKALTKIFPAKISNRGLTLIEILVSLTIIAVIIAIGAPRLARSFGSPLKTTTRKLVLLTKQLHSSAKLRQKTYRLVLEFEDQDNRIPYRFYVESATKGGLADLGEYDKYKSGFKKENEESPFRIDKEFVKKPEALPRGIKFTGVEIESLETPITEKKAYIHFYPQGLIQRSIIRLSSGLDKEISLIINPLTGRTDIQDGVVTLKELNR